MRRSFGVVFWQVFRSRDTRDDYGPESLRNGQCSWQNGNRQQQRYSYCLPRSNGEVVTLPSLLKTWRRWTKVSRSGLRAVLHRSPLDRLQYLPIKLFRLDGIGLPGTHPFWQHKIYWFRSTRSVLNFRYDNTKAVLVFASHIRVACNSMDALALHFTFSTSIRA